MSFSYVELLDFVQNKEARKAIEKINSLEENTY